MEAAFHQHFAVDLELQLEAVFSCQNLEAGQHSWQHLEVAFLAGLWPHFEAEQLLEAVLCLQTAIEAVLWPHFEAGLEN